MEFPPPASLSCTIAAEIRPWAPPPAVATGADSIPAASQAEGPAEQASDYRHQLKPTPAGWPIRSHWCVWVEPVRDGGATGIWEQRWHQAVMAALATWQRHLPITLVEQPERAQVLVERRRPPRLNNRASHGRAVLQLLEVQRQQTWQLEPRVTVLISPGQAQPAIQATALHELGHAFGLWGHSDQAGDAMAAKPGSIPILELSERDQRTLRWLQQQPGLSPSTTP